MKIGIITDVIDDGGAGIGTYVKNLVKQLKKIDKKNQYYLIHYKKNNDLFYKDEKEIIIPIPKIPFGREIRKIFLMPKKLNKLDIVHETAQIGPFFLKSKFKKIVTICDIAPLVIPESQTKRRILHHKLSLGTTIKKVDKIITISESTKKDLIDKFKISPKKIKTILLSSSNSFKITNKELSKKTIKEKYNISQPFFLFVSTIEPRKNLTRIIKSFDIFNQKNPEYKLIIVGKYGWKSKEIIKKIKRNKSIIHLKNVSNQDLIHLYNISHALIYPSLYEGFGLPILEAMKCGCPVITSNCSSMPEVAKNAAILINSKSTNEILNSMEILKNEKIRSELIKKGLERSKKFSWEKCAKETMKIYNNLK